MRSFQYVGPVSSMRVLPYYYVGRACLTLLVIILPLVLVADIIAAERYELRIPGNDTITSQCVVDEQKLTLIDKRGGTFDYLRAADQDSRDGMYRAYWSDKAAQFLRWPTSNSGSLQIGKRTGRSVSWRASSMQIFAVQTDETKISDSNELPLDTYQHQIASVLSPDDQQYAAQVDSAGQLQLFRHDGNLWQYQSKFSGSDLGKDAPVWLGWSNTDRQPVVYSVDQQGLLYSMQAGARRNLHRDQNVRFDRTAEFLISQRGDQQVGIMADRRGRLWEIDLGSGNFTSIDAQQNRFLPNTQLSLARSPTDHLFAIDRSGNLLSYEMLASGWSAATPVRVPQFNTRFVAGGDLQAVAADGRDSMYVASVDRDGMARLLERRDGRWRSLASPDHRFAPGSTLAMQFAPPSVSRSSQLRVSPSGTRPDNRLLSLSGIDPRGDWYSLKYDSVERAWQESLLGSGFNPSVAPRFQNRNALALDRNGRLIAANPFAQNPSLSLLSPRYEVAPIISTRTVFENPQLPPARVSFRNTSGEELLVKLYDTRTDVKISEFRIPAGGESTQSLRRYSGATVEETLLISDPYGNVRGESSRIHVPAANIYHVVVWVNRVTSVFYDRVRNKGPIPDKESKSLVSLGVFPLPAGPDLTDGLTLDVMAISKDQRNPGAAGVFRR